MEQSELAWVAETVFHRIINERHLLRLIDSTEVEIWCGGNIAVCELLLSHDDIAVREQAEIWLLNLRSSRPLNHIRRAIADYLRRMYGDVSIQG